MPAEGPPVISWSCTDAPALVLGRAPRDPPLDRAAAAAAGIGVHRRRSGGGPVLWDDGLLALDVVLPPGHGLAPADVVEGYRWLGEAIAQALRELGAAGAEAVPPARARTAAPGPGAAACFGGLSPYEVLVDGRKVVGLCQARRARGTLLQAGILMALDASGLARLLIGDAAEAEALASDLARRAVGLDRVAPGVGAGAVVAAVDAALTRAAGAPLRPSAPTAEEARREAEAAAGAHAAEDAAGADVGMAAAGAE